MKIVFYSTSPKGALPTLRMIGPATQLGIDLVFGYQENEILLEEILQSDMVIIQRDICRKLDAFEKIISISHDYSIPVVFDLDDLLFFLPENHPDRINDYYVDALLPMLQAIMEVDLVTVTSRELREYILPLNPNTVVIPNYFDDRIWKMKDPQKHVVDTDTIIIGYMGGDSHKHDLEMVSTILLELAEESSIDIRYKFWGIDPPTNLTQYSSVDWYPPKSNNYEDFANYFQKQSVDIFIAPLVDNLFNSCKSPIKFFEYSSIGAPGVYSKVAPYISVINDGEDGFLATSSADWKRALLKLIDEPNLRVKMAENAQKKIVNNWLLSNNASARLNLYLDLIDNPRRGLEISNPIHRFIKSISRQIYDRENRMQMILSNLEDDNKNYKETIEKCEQKNAFLLDQIIQRDEEILAYALSTSWKITRPLRKIAKIIKSS